MGGLILRGVGMAIGLALWPITLPVAVVVLVGAAIRGQPSESLNKGQQQAITDWQPPAPEPGPVMPGLREQHLAIVTERNREHLERCATSDK